jgi:hypothetical protein
MLQPLLGQSIEVPDGTRSMKVYWKAPHTPEMQSGTYNVRPIYRVLNVYRAVELFKKIIKGYLGQKIIKNENFFISHKLLHKKIVKFFNSTRRTNHAQRIDYLGYLLLKKYLVTWFVYLKYFFIRHIDLISQIVNIRKRELSFIHTVVGIVVIRL